MATETFRQLLEPLSCHRNHPVYPYWSSGQGGPPGSAGKNSCSPSTTICTRDEPMNPRCGDSCPRRRDRGWKLASISSV